ncbi:Scr1 family TA system antitoxin-like transcriptional regulator [Nocardiopsis alba]|uniref:helix-turn-helix domain-containing protein n=1 Tax=Nocardiopsis alba TaxID=53437 RepID=UPI003820FD4F
MQDDRNPPDVRFGQALMRARKRAGKQQAVVARHLGCTPGHLSHIENGRRKLDESKLQELDDFLNAGKRLLRQHEEIYQPERVDWLGEFHQMQADAAVIREYQNSLFPGTVQHPEYAKIAITSGAPWLASNEVQERIKDRQRWHEDVLRDDGPQYHLVLDDIVIMRPIGPAAVMRKQLDTIIKHAESGRVMVQMHGWDQHPHAGLDGPFALITSSSAPDMVHVESIYGGQNTDVPQDVRNFGTLFSRLQATARSPLESLRFLKEMREKYAQQ